MITVKKVRLHVQLWVGPCPAAFVPGQWYGDRTYKQFLHDNRPFSFSEERDCKAKVDFIEASIRHEHDFEHDDPTDPEICGIVDWLASRSAAEACMSFASCCTRRALCAR